MSPLNLLRRQTVEMVGVVNAHIIDAVKAEPSLEVETTESPTPRSMEVTESPTPGFPVAVNPLTALCEWPCAPPFLRSAPLLAEPERVPLAEPEGLRC